MEKSLIPDYDNPPIVETILGVQFERLPGLKNAHLGAFWKSLGTDEWPTVFDAPLLQPQFERFTESARWATIGLELKLTQDLATRLQIKNNDANRMIQIQNDQLHFNWLGQQGSPYVRYPKVREGFVWALQRFIEFVAQEKVGVFRPNQWEVMYLNYIPKGSVWKTPNDWGFFRLLGAGPPMGGLVEGESFNGAWHFVIPGQRGRLHIGWQPGLKSEPAEQEMVVLTLTARGPLDPSNADEQAALEGLDLGHETIVRSFEKFMTDEANKYWGLKHANG